jgi:putative membrane-bound dehydrogenase-like protein
MHFKLTLQSGLVLCVLLGMPVGKTSGEAPRALDDRLTIELVAEHPQIVTPTGLAVDHRGRVFVAESHTHFRPDDYDGPQFDRILIFEDTDGDGRADKRTVFHEGFTHVMDIEFHRDGGLYVATRKDIHRLQDTDGDDRADQIALLVRLETKGNYPHNGLSGIAFDFSGGFHFGLGENLGESYELIGADGVRIKGGGEGGSTYHVQDDGTKLRRVSTGWWNPYGLCTDSFGRVFGTDNDPDSSPPCRLIQVVEGGDYGYEFRYGRSGRNPLITWDGEIPGTLPMIAGTGEAPCHIVAYESDALPAEYFGNLLVPSWADHRVEYYALVQRPDRGLVETKRKSLIEGPDDFRPVGIDVAPDGSVYLSDWVSSSYTLHKQGRIWRIRPRQMPSRSKDDSVAQRLAARDRRIRESAAVELEGTQGGRFTLRLQYRTGELPQARATALAALTRVQEAAYKTRADVQAPLELRVLATRLGSGSDRWQDSTTPTPLRAALLEHATPPAEAVQQLAEVLGSTDPWLRHAAIHALSRTALSGEQQNIESAGGLRDSRPLPLLLALKLALKRGGNSDDLAEVMIKDFFRSNDPLVRFAAVKWVADELLSNLRPQLELLLEAPDLDLRTFLGLNVALERLDGQRVTDRPSPERLKARIVGQQTPLALRRLCLRLVDPNAARLDVGVLAELVHHSDPELRLEAVRTLSRHEHSGRFEILLAIARDPKQPTGLRAEAILGLSSKPESFADSLITLASDADSQVRDEALRALVGVPLNDAQRTAMKQTTSAGPSVEEAVLRAIEQKPPVRPASQDTAGWSQVIPESGDPLAGERIFFGTKIGRCSTCHQVQGLGASVGPDLSQMSRRVASAGSDGKRWLLETILQPGRDMAPQFTPWQIVTKDGKQYTGLPRRKGGNSEAYLGTDGREFSLKNADIESRRESPVSIMPADLLRQLTRQELADLFAFLTASR